MLGDRTFTFQSCFSFTRRFKKCWQLFDSLLTHYWTKNGGWARFVWSVGLFPIVQTSIDGRGYSSTNKAAWKSFDVEVWWTCLRFIGSCVFPFEWPTRMSDKESTSQKNSPRKRDGWPRRVFFKASILDRYYTERYGSTNLRRSTGT